MEPVLVILIIFVSIIAMAKMSFDYKRRELTARQGDGGSLRTSELKQLIREAVDEALEPVIENLESRSALPPANESKLLAGATEEKIETESER